MKRINVIGTTGSGKSTFCKNLAERLGYPYIQMDQLFWKSDWNETADDEFMHKVIGAVSGDAWVLDGNYSRTNKIKWKNADTIIWLDYSYSRTLFQLFKRTICRIIMREELWPETGNRESFRKSFMSKDSIFVWFFKYYRKNKIRYVELIESPSISHIKFICLHNPKAAKNFLDDVKSSSE